MRWVGLLVICALAGCKERRPEPENAPLRAAAAAESARDVGSARAADSALPPHWTYPTPRAALEALLRRVRPRVLGIGEAHLIAGGPAVRSALSRFTGAIDLFAGRASDLVVETWVADGRCGEVETGATAAVRADTERPAEVESEIAILLRRAAELELRRHVLYMTCDHYRHIRPDGGPVDYDRLLALIGRELLATVRRALGAGPRGMVVVYGGALHNDRAPNQGVAAYSYGVELARELGAGYVELDLYVPELIASDPVLQAEPWFPLTRAVGAAGGPVVLIERGKASYVLLLERGVRS